MQTFFRENHQDPNGLIALLQATCEDLVLISETDAPVTPFVGSPAAELTAQTILQQTGKAATEPVEERDFDEFFSRLTAIRDWYGEPEMARAKKFLELYELLKENLRERKVFRIGKIRLDIFAVGLDKDGYLTGVSTHAVET